MHDTPASEQNRNVQSCIIPVSDGPGLVTLNKNMCVVIYNILLYDVYCVRLLAAEAGMPWIRSSYNRPRRSDASSMKTGP